MFTNKNNSAYRAPPIEDFYLGLWNPSVAPKPREDDVIMQIPPEFHLRPDLMAYDLYGDPRLFWVFATVNMDVLIDPINDFKSGTTIYAPARGTF